MQKIIKQAYQAEVLLRKVQVLTIGSRFPYKDQVVLTTENTYQHPDFDLFTYTQRVDVIIPCENRNEATKLYIALKKYFNEDEMMLPLNVGVFQKPWTAQNQKSRKHYAYSIDNAKTLLNLIPELLKDKSLKYQVGHTNVESNFIENGFDLTYHIQDFSMEHLFMVEDFDGKPLDEPFYRLSLYTTSIFENEDPKTKDITQSEEIVVFHIKGDSESEIIELAKIFYNLRRNNEIITDRGSFPKPEKDFYSVNLSKSANDFILSLKKEKKLNEKK